MHRRISFCYIFGPTGSGKTGLAYKLYKLRPEESLLVSVDSRKLYTGLDVGTHKAPLLDLIKKGIPVLGINLFAPTKRVSAAMFIERLLPALKEYVDRGKTRIIFFGGSGLYMEALLNLEQNLSFVPPDYKLREKLRKLSLKELFGKLERLDPTIKLNRSEANNRVRLIRKVEVLLNRRVDTFMNLDSDRFNYFVKWYQELQEGASIQLFLFNPFLDTPMKAKYYRKLKYRAFKMVHEGLVQEVKSLVVQYSKKQGCEYCPFKEIPGYKQVYKLLSKYSSERLDRYILTKLVDTIYVAHRRYAKYQLSFSRRILKRYNYPTYLFY